MSVYNFPFDNFDDIRMFFVVVAYKFDNSNVDAAKLRFFVENSAINFFKISQNFIQSLNMFKYFFSNFEQNFFMIFKNILRSFNVYIIQKKNAMREIWFINIRMIIFTNCVTELIAFCEKIVIRIKSTKIWKAVKFRNVSIKKIWS